MVSIKNFTVFTEKEITDKEIVFTKKTRIWCQLPYPKHKNGCPNYGKKANCPPNVEYLEGKLEKYIYKKILLCRFNFNKYKKEMKIHYPDWTDKKLGCCLYWQGQIRKVFKNTIKKLTPDLVLTCGSGVYDSPSMEASGINVIQTLKNIGITDIEIKPVNIIYLVCLIGFYTKRGYNYDKI
jgi:hypothetical protein